MMTAPDPDAEKRPSPLLLVLAPIPGVGHWALRRGGRGLLVFAAFAFGVNLILMAHVMKPVIRIAPAWGWGIGGAAVAFSVVDVGRIVLGGRRKAGVPEEGAG